MKRWYAILLVPVLCLTLSADPISFDSHSSGLSAPTAIDIATKKGIEQIALQWWLVNGGIDDQEAVEIDGYFSAIRPIKGFADKGDVIWEVRFILSQQLIGVLWINQKTGKVEALGRVQR